MSVLLGASNDATVLEVRMDDRPGVVHLVCRTLAELGLSVRSAHVATHGPQALDVFYVVGPDGRQLEGDGRGGDGSGGATGVLGRDYS